MVGSHCSYERSISTFLTFGYGEISIANMKNTLILMIVMGLTACAGAVYSPGGLEHAYTFAVPMNYQAAYRKIHGHMYDEHNTAGILVTLDVDGQLYTDIPHGEIIVSSAGVGRLYATKIDIDGTGPDSCEINGFANFKRWKTYDAELKKILSIP